ncbi:hypothetical protein E6P09_12265 [Haloferax mediterranei ATCC 33500]|uniref:Uncharacterized protein n=1 Tax=Haloferax mediterranei (strain ATCC 33500 / DSM 1411 / JCM 8866 / NBRC 14739 / NCIMB 2177 / R-4) TaxID=523841 RepID=I3R8L3_HALMT|nr:hypothetical protein [Haloferax mediterranei]AFK20573.1 hypothetical protein HFX_2903 [Haloferax mediterranei ATCC 33500]AHZ23930.1 hypothetical protein BM92_15315 [Haloferax mediterranei ATCC 33500]ELZ98356.1 hypothetical protein C439_16265 [Haloferax mediterranei ATCC 33500]MDX5986670.1 hypothetical protein [Haloferax mediterranei ATCC 33500]QCQ76002.1 hypothetical protein E6P09_12265 [Haloferax mediterranei ATCC 33500]
MAKVSVGLRGWRFEESEIFSEDGEFKPLDEIPEDSRKRLVRLISLVEEPCDACYLIHGDEEIHKCRQARIVYGEPGEEALLCDQHEPDFLYWFREEGGRDFVGDVVFADAFHEWFADGGRAPDGYGGLEHVDTDPDELPSPPDANEIQRRLEANFEGERIDIRDYDPNPDEDATPLSEDDLDGVDLDADYPTK